MAGPGSGIMGLCNGMIHPSSSGNLTLANAHVGAPMLKTSHQAAAREEIWLRSDPWARIQLPFVAGRRGMYPSILNESCVYQWPQLIHTPHGNETAP
jgi:hypothetical protein